ncbi:MAG: class I SAM-dependent methyltransferase [Cyanobacteriota bacterium]|nr:class I SAM-dependent methyltransferase [Cyanobacteriota bacterium]
MNLTNTQRVLKLAGALVRQPQYTPPYLLSNLSVTRHSPLAQNFPWWSFAAIQQADRLFPGKRIFEWGSGGSTLRYAQMGAQITAIEDDSEWLEAVQTALEKAGVAHQVTMKYIPFDFDQPAHFTSSSYCQAHSDGSWDVVIIDGQDKTFCERITCFRHAEPRMQPGSIILVDDFWRYEELLSSNRARNVQVFESVGPCRIGVTSTAMFFY